MVIELGSVVKLSRPFKADKDYKNAVGIVVFFGVNSCTIRVESPWIPLTHINIGVMTHRLDEL